VGTCPRDDLRCPAITGCGDHRPNFVGNEPIISTVRDPSSRLILGFFDYPPHRPDIKKGHSWKVFKDDYIKDPTYRNVMTKMFSESYAYNLYDEKQHTLEHAKKNVCTRLAWFGIVEFPILSALLLYEATPFSLLIPNPVAFGLALSDDATYYNTSDMDGLFSANDGSEYLEFRSKTFVRRDGESFVQKYNEEDYELYNFMQQLFCIRVRDTTPDLQDEVYDIASNEIHTCRKILLHTAVPDGSNTKNNPISEIDLCGGK
jgi:hypothetical protein